MRGRSKHYDTLRQYCETQPIVDCHDHSGVCGPKYADFFGAFVAGYFGSDLHSALSDAEIAILADGSRSCEDRWPLLQKAWRRTCHTGYAQVTRRVLKKFYGVEEFSLEALKAINGKMRDFTDPQAFEAVLEDAKIVARIEDVWPDAKKVLDGTLKLSPRGRLAISLPSYHAVQNYWGIQSVGGTLGRNITSLDEYLGACREIFAGFKKFGAVCFKDQSAYSRCIDYGNPTRAAAEEVFNHLLADPRRTVAYPQGAKPLDDHLFHEFMRIARDLDLPVQIHTGHMAGIRNDIVKTNAANLTSVLELHKDVRFDLFHANWPYGDELMFLGKNYPNVSIDFCWANIIDPIYCQRLFQQALSAVPHGKVHGYGSDYCGQPDRAWAHASIARDNIAIALSDMVDLEYLGLDDARQVARMWLFENANEFFRLGL